MSKPWIFPDELPDPRSSIKTDVYKLIISLILEYNIKYNKFISVNEIWHIFQSHPSIRKNKDYQYYLLAILGKCKAYNQLFIDNNGDLLEIKPG